ncbi:sigma 54-interacting transcriptional regulator [candidate division KSB1 bacterium]|nr:sigma 54-interacting transcriptional regulator [candidate division KSB1 bacterium]
MEQMDGIELLKATKKPWPVTQVMLLRCLQENEIRRVPDSSTRTVDVRLVVATNKKLEDEIARGRFREDLYHRINVIPLPLPF